MSSIAIIPARGGSKRLPRKNILPLKGQPLLAYSVKAALESGCFDRVIVSTEDAEIADHAIAAGAELRHRAAGLATDTATMAEVCLDVLDWVEADSGQAPETFACLLATAALRRAEHIRGARELLHPGRCDFVMGVTTYAKSPYQAMVADEDNCLSLLWPDLANKRRWEIATPLVDNGSVYWATTSRFRELRDWYGPGLRGYPMPRACSVDVDDAEDFALLEFWMDRDGRS